MQTKWRPTSMVIAVLLLGASGGLYSWLAPSPSFAAEGVNGKIIFASSRDGNYELYLMDPDGTNEVRLTNNPSNDLSPEWSPNGTKILFIRDNAIHIMDSDGRNIKKLTPSEPAASDPSWSPDGKRIAFSAADGEDRDIYVIEGGVAREITNSDSDDFEPDWSPDGEMIVFSSASNSSDIDIFVMNADGTGRTLIASDGSNRHPSWSPNGTRIAFASDRVRSFDIYTADKNGTDVARLTNTTSSEAYPSWSPDGGKIVFTNTKSARAEQVYVMNADGSKQQRLTRNLFSDIFPQFHPLKAPANQELPILRENGNILFTSDRVENFTEIYIMNHDNSVSGSFVSSPDSADAMPKWAPDGSKVAYVSMKQGYQEIAVVDPDGANRTSFGLSTSPYAGFGWSPDGTKLVFSKGDPHHRWIFTINSDGSGSRRLTFDPEPDSDPSWSPDGEMIAFTRDFGEGSTDIYVMTKEGKELKKITNHPGHDYYPKWSPEGDQIAFVTDRDGNREVYVMNPDGKKLRNLSNNTGDDHSPSWSPDGTKIIFVSDRDQEGQDIHIMDFDGKNIRRLTTSEANESEPDFGPLTEENVPVLPPGDRGDEILQPLRVSPLVSNSEYPPPLDAIAVGRPVLISTTITNEDLNTWKSAAIMQVRDTTGITLHIDTKQLEILPGDNDRVEFRWTPSEAGGFELLLFVVDDSQNPSVIGSKVSSTVTVPKASP